MIAGETQAVDGPERHRVIVLETRRLIREGIAEMLSAYADLEIAAVGGDLPDDASGAVVVVGRTTVAVPTDVRRVMLDGFADPAALVAAVRHASLRVQALSINDIAEARGSLTSRERSVLRAVSVGDSAAEIAAALHISPRTVERHKQNARAKLGGPNHAVTIARALERGLLDEPT